MSSAQIGAGVVILAFAGVIGASTLGLVLTGGTFTSVTSLLLSKP